MDTISKSEFNSYQTIQLSGKYNMIMDSKAVMMATGLSKVKYWEIIQHYDSLKAKFSGGAK